MKQIYDVIVVGGGPAGIMAAMASGKLGADTLLIEKNGSVKLWDILPEGMECRK